MVKYIQLFKKKSLLFYKIISLTILVSLLGRPQIRFSPTSAEANVPMRRVNVPYLGTAPPVSSFTPAVFWFGQVNPTSNYADVRIYYYDQYLEVVFHVIDRLLWYDTNPSASELTKWDAVSLYLNLDGNQGNMPGSNSYRFDGQLNAWETRDNWQGSYQGNGTAWSLSSINFSTESFWRGNYPNDTTDDNGWSITFRIPFASIGLQTKPDQGTIWGLGVVLHDRDDAPGTPIPDEHWPEAMETNNPSTWGQLRFGIPGYNPPAVIPEGVTTIRQGLNGASVHDAAVGGNFNCGYDYGPYYWDDWGSANYAGDSQINIQNQWDISDWPCFSKYYVTYPLDAIPKGYTIISATLTMYLTGTAGGGVWGEPPNSYIQALTVGEDWNESTITWNNAPLADENITGTWVYPKTTDYWPTYTWNVSRAVADAYAAGIPLRLALYSGDGDYHTGKYFTSSDWSDAIGRPNLKVSWGLPCESSNVTCNITNSYLPLTIK